jgi:hypothetical protein
MHRSNHIKHYRKQLYFLRLTKRDVTSAQCSFNWNSSVVVTSKGNTRWFKYDREDLCVNKSQFVPVIFEPPCMCISLELNPS